MERRENLLTAMRGGKPERVPSLLQDSFFFCPSVLKIPDSVLFGMLYGMMAEGLEPEEPLMADDCFGVKWVLDDNGPFPVPGLELFDDIADWREKFIIPSLEGYDWDTACAEDMAIMFEEDKASLMFVYGLFTTLNNAMGFVNSLLAIAEDPDEVQAFFEAVTDFYCKVIENVMSRVRIDIIQICDDVASNDMLFISPDYYHEALMPMHKRIYDAARKANPDVVLEMHCCGKCEKLVDDYIAIGAQAWEPAEPQNDLVGIRAKHGNKIAFVGAFRNQDAQGNDHITEADVRQMVRDSIDTYGRDGAYVGFNMFVGSSERTQERSSWYDDEIATYGAEVYK